MSTSTYVVLYTSLANIDRELQLETTGASKPNDDDVLHYIEEVEAGINARNLGSQTISGAIFDATEWNKGTDGGVYVYPDYPSEDSRGVVIVPPYTPIISIGSGYTYINDGGLGDTTDWTLVKEGPGSDTDYVVLKRLNKKSGKYLGYAIYFYGDLPTAGHSRIRANITYGENVNAKILQEYATLQVVKRVINSRLMSGNPSNIATYTAGANFQSYANTQYEAQLRYIDSRCKEISDTHFPKSLAYSLLRGV